MVALKLTQIGNSTGLILPKEALTKLGVKKGDTLFVSESAEGLVLSAFDPDIAAALEVAERGERKFRNALRELAK
jgi:putative addiction module antidote